MKEKKIYKIENEAAKKNPRRNYIEYYVNEEKKTVTAVLTGVRQEMSGMFEKKFANAGFSAHGNAWFLGRTEALSDVMKFVPDKLVATATCVPEDDFDVEFGCSLARMRLIEKLYKYRERVSYDLAVKVGMLQCVLMDYSEFCGIKIENLMEDIDITLSEHD